MPSKQTFLSWLTILAVIMFDARTSYAEDGAGENLKSTSVAEFTTLPKHEQIEVLRSAVLKRLELFDNIAYSTKLTFPKTNVDLRGFPYEGGIDAPPVTSQFSFEYSSKRLAHSYLSRVRRRMHFPNGNLDEFLVCKYDASNNRYTQTATPFGETNTVATMETGQDHADDQDRLAHWGRGGRKEQGVFFLSESLAALEGLKNGFGPMQGVSIRTVLIDRTETLALEFRSDLPGPRWTGELTVHFDPARQFLPVAYRLERSDKTKIRFFEAMLVTEADKHDEYWLPKHFQIVQSSGSLPIPGSISSLQDIIVKSIRLGVVTANDLDSAIPHGTEVVDRIRQVRFVADGNGGSIGAFKSLTTTGFLYRNAISILCVTVPLVAFGVYLRRRTPWPPWPRIARKNHSAANPIDSVTESQNSARGTSPQFTVRALLLVTFLIAAGLAYFHFSSTRHQDKLHHTYQLHLQHARKFEALRDQSTRRKAIRVISAQTGKPMPNVVIMLTLIGPDGGDGGARTFRTDVDGYAYVYGKENPGRYQYHLTYEEDSMIRSKNWRRGDPYLTLSSNTASKPTVLELP